MLVMKRRMYYSFTVILFIWGHWLVAQPVFIDQPVQAGDLLVFRHITDSSKYFYLPNKLALGKTKSGLPQFSFLRYVQNVKTKPGTDQVLEGEGGGIVHALVELSVSPNQITRAQSALRSKTKNDKAVIVGP